MASPIARSFPPIENPNATKLILGSMPGRASLEANQYYAHPRNAFWPIVGHICQFDPSLPYNERIKAIKAADIALWDVLAQCTRVGSLDSAIEQHSKVSNDFIKFLHQHPHIELIAFNGAEAEKSFKQLVLPNLKSEEITLVRLPSTSPAHTIPMQQKLATWQAALSR